MARVMKSGNSNSNGSALGFETTLAPTGMARFVLANGSMSSTQSGDGNARSAPPMRAADSPGLGSQRDIRRALNETV